MMTNEKAPFCGSRNGAGKRDGVGKHPVPIVSHPRPLCKRTRVKLVWTPLNFALLVLMFALIVYLTVKALTKSPLDRTDLLVSMSNSVFRI